MTLEQTWNPSDFTYDYDLWIGPQKRIDLQELKRNLPGHTTYMEIVIVSQSEEVLATLNDQGMPRAICFGDTWKVADTRLWALSQKGLMREALATNDSFISYEDSNMTMMKLLVDWAKAQKVELKHLPMVGVSDATAEEGGILINKFRKYSRTLLWEELEKRTVNSILELPDHVLCDHRVDDGEEICTRCLMKP